MQGHARPIVLEMNAEMNYVPAPLPLEIPPPPDLSSLPVQVLHSGTVETLIGQNEDLMARLKVNIRRNSILEQQIMEHDRIASELTRINGSLTSQLQVLQEKDRIWKEKSSLVDNRHNGLREELNLVSEKLRASEERREELHAGLLFESAFRRRVRLWVRPLVDHLKHQLSAERSRAGQLEQTLHQREAVMSDLRERLTEAMEHIQTQEARHSKDHAKLVEQYETKQTRIESELVKNRAELKLTRDKSLRLDEAISMRTELENRIVYFERKTEELESRLSNERLEAQKQITQYRQEAKVLAVETLSSAREITLINEETQKLRDDHARLQDQYESLQTVWTETQKKMDASRVQQEALSRLNQELGRQLKGDRKARTDANAPNIRAVGESPSAGRLERIDNMLAELESGFIKPRSPEVAQMRELDIVETPSPSRREKNPEAQP